jgi:transposase
VPRCVHDTIEDRYSKVFPFTVDRQDFERFLLFLRRQGPNEEVIVGVEASGPYALTIGHFLLDYGYTIVELNPFQASQFRKAQGKKAKTDRIDARSLAAFRWLIPQQLASEIFPQDSAALLQMSGAE